MLAILDMGDTMYELRGLKLVTDSYPATLNLFVTGEKEPQVINGDIDSVTYMAKLIRQSIINNVRVINMDEVMKRVQEKVTLDSSLLSRMRALDVSDDKAMRRIACSDLTRTADCQIVLDRLNSVPIKMEVLKSREGLETFTKLLKNHGFQLVNMGDCETE